jgi:hypothetical protein
MVSVSWLKTCTGDVPVTEKLVAASAVTFSVALAPGPGVPTSFEVTVLLVTMNAPLAVEPACTKVGTSQDSPGLSELTLKLILVEVVPPLPEQVMAPRLPRVIPEGNVTLTAIPVNEEDPLGLVIVRSYSEVFDPPATTVEGVKLALTVA